MKTTFTPFHTDTKEYLQELDKTLHKLPIHDSKKSAIA